MKPAFYMVNRQSKEVRPVAFKGLLGALYSPNIEDGRDISPEDLPNWERIPASRVARAGRGYRLR